MWLVGMFRKVTNYLLFFKKTKINGHQKQKVGSGQNSASQRPFFLLV